MTAMTTAIKGISNLSDMMETSWQQNNRLQRPIHNRLQRPIHNRLQRPIHNRLQRPIHNRLQRPIHNRLQGKTVRDTLGVRSQVQQVAATGFRHRQQKILLQYASSTDLIQSTEKVHQFVNVVRHSIPQAGRRTPTFNWNED
ncbi:hypothetical protein HELRODRAFT_173018 [Helobdella robusta]|uniref:Uncharacterized protein n=1 Tax=Helobdella robusta TaxID=6412 RepID=T1F698_HELRO|nr:hypothetical protein HELRODRAFT_173018 [Helobdella robusta]ESO03975.1 hypothetical protein HELRODRAFT_173018 [Helobdella robusta]